MLNKDINSRFEDWLLSPSEALDFEVKSWLDLSDIEARATVAKALIALENHGGGLLLIGYIKGDDGQLVPDLARPSDLSAYNTDNINSIVKKYAEPVFHVDVTLQKHPELALEFPILIVRGESKVPVRAERDSPKNSIRKDVYYIRRPGPSSEAPQSGAEWDALIRRCVLKQREDIVAVLRAFLPSGTGEPSRPQPSEVEILQRYSAPCYSRWTALNAELDEGHPAKVTLGHYAFSARIVGKLKGLAPRDMLQALEMGKRYTGWPMFVTLHQELTKPYLADGNLQAWLAHTTYPDVGHADFWRISPDGNFYVLRGYQEDSLGADKVVGPAGTLFEATLPIWRVGEFLLRVVDLGAHMFEPDFKVVARCEWTGLNGRKLFVRNNRRYIPGYACKQDTVSTSGEFSEAAIRELLPDVVKELTLSLYAHFAMFQPPDAMYAEELQQMLKGNQ